MSNNNNFAQDVFEQLAELGQSTAKQSVKAVTQSFNPLSPVLEKGKSSEQTGLEKQLESLKKQQKGHTPLDFNKLNDSYKTQDLTAIAQQRKFLNMVKADEEKAILESKQKEEDRKQMHAFEEAQKKAEEQQKLTSEPPAEAHGKARGIFGRPRPKGIVDISAEAKPSKPKG